MLPVTFLPPAVKYFKKLKDKQLKKKYEEVIIKIRQNPDAGELKLGDLAGIRSHNISHGNVNYEIAYRLSINENGDTVVVIMAGTRENFYEALKKYIFL